MSLPEILEPAGIARFFISGHGFAPRPVYSDVPMGTGHTRRRRVSTIAPRVIDVGKVLTVDQMAAYDAWFENTLIVGTRHFTAVFQYFLEPPVYWEAQWIAPYIADPIPGGTWLVSGQLLLLGEGSLTPPVSTSLGLEITMPLTGSARITVGAPLAVEFISQLRQPLALALEISVPLLNYSPDLRVTTTAARRVTSTGDRRKVNNP